MLLFYNFKELKYYICQASFLETVYKKIHLIKKVESAKCPIKAIN